MRASQDSRGPGTNFSFQSDAFPAVSSAVVPDLSEQVAAFLATNRSSGAVPPEATLWVFTLGTWDVWALATAPTEISMPVVGLLVDRVFEQIERLYAAALDQESVAWSGTRSDENGTVVREQRFQVLVPALFDPSMTPGWRTERPRIPAVHSKAEQMRNSAALTNEWNRQLQFRVDEWVNEGPRTRAGLGIERRQNEREKAAAAAVGGGVKDEPRRLPRDGIIFDMPSYVLHAMMETQLRKMKREGEGDGAANGTDPEYVGFNEVRDVCATSLAKVKADVDDDDDDGGSGEEEKGADASGARSIPSFRARRAAHLKPDSEWQRQRLDTRNTIPNKKQHLDADEAVLSVCDRPDEHLFYTSFTVGQRAADAIGRMAAELARELPVDLKP